jgi:hypothetical protein
VENTFGGIPMSRTITPEILAACERLGPRGGKMLKVLSVCLLPTLAIAQVSQVLVQVTNQDEKSVTYRVTNNSTIPLTCFGVAVDVTYSDGTTNRSGANQCHLQSSEMLAPQASTEENQNFGSNEDHGTVTKLLVQPTLAVFQDASYQKTDDAMFHRLMENIGATIDGERDVIAAIQRANNDPVKAAAALEALRAKAKPGFYESQLKNAINYLQSNPTDVKGYLARTQREYALHKPYADLRGAK